MEDRRRSRGRTGSALAVSLLLHVAVVGIALAANPSAPKPPKTKVYAVDIVSPPPNVAGEPLEAPPATQEPGPAAPAQPAPAETTPEPAPQPTPPAPEPDPAPPKDAPREPAKAPEPRRTPEQPKQRPVTQPEQPKQRPSTTQPNRPASTTTNANRPAQNPPSTNRPATNRPSSGSQAQSGTGSGSNRTQGTGTRTGPATGRNPDANSPGGEGLNIHVEGDPCPVAGYCENVTRQVNRFFRPPPGTAGATGEICFRIQRDGSVTDIQPQRVRGGGAAFRLAMMEAAEAAGSRRSFGTLPGAFDPARWRWCVELSPS